MAGCKIQFLTLCSILHPTVRTVNGKCSISPASLSAVCSTESEKRLVFHILILGPICYDAWGDYLQLPVLGGVTPHGAMETLQYQASNNGSHIMLSTTAVYEPVMENLCNQFSFQGTRAVLSAAGPGDGLGFACLTECLFL